MKVFRLIKMCLNETYIEVRIDKHLSYSFPLDYAIRNSQENQVGLQLNGTHQLLVYADDVNLLCDSIDTIKKNT
jgi:hypothetical protein